jgi:hypothetical protein
MSDRPGKQAIVVGGSIAGLITARVLSDYFEQVLIIERDEIADQPVIHKSVPRGITSMHCCMEVCRFCHRCIRHSPKTSGGPARRKSLSDATLSGICPTARRTALPVR